MIAGPPEGKPNKAFGKGVGPEGGEHVILRGRTRISVAPIGGVTTTSNALTVRLLAFSVKQGE
jgi:hypothetical protein